MYQEFSCHVFEVSDHMVLLSSWVKSRFNFSPNHFQSYGTVRMLYVTLMLVLI